MVNSFAGFTTDLFGSVPSMQSSWSMVNGLSSAPCVVIAARTTSCIVWLNESGETTKAGRLFDELRSVNGKETKTMSSSVTQSHLRAQALRWASKGCHPVSIYNQV